MRLRDSTQCNTDSSWILTDSSIGKYTLHIHIYICVYIIALQSGVNRSTHISGGRSHIRALRAWSLSRLAAFTCCFHIRHVIQLGASTRLASVLTRTILQQQQQQLKQQLYLDGAPTNGEYPVRARAQNRIWSLAKPARNGQNYSFVSQLTQPSAGGGFTCY